MSRVKKQRAKKETRRKVVIYTVACILLLYWGLTVVDANNRELLGTSYEGGLLKVASPEKDIIQVDIIGERILISKERVQYFIDTFKERLLWVKKEVLHIQ